MPHVAAHPVVPAFASAEFWPAVPLKEWRATRDTLHMWTQIVGKVRMELTPLVNHWWNVPLYVTARGLTTSPIPYRDRSFQVDFDFIDHRLIVATSKDETVTLPLEPKSVAEFYRDFMTTLWGLGIEVKIFGTPVEVPDPIPFEQDRDHDAYDPEYAQRFWRILLLVERVFVEFRSHFLGKCSPVHFFWGSFDLAVTRFSGRRAPERPDADSITREAYSHEVSSVGFWPGGGAVTDAAFYSYMAPEPQGYSDARARPQAAYYEGQLHEFLLMYDQVRNRPNPDADLLEFCQSTYEAGASLGNWDRDSLERRSDSLAGRLT
jgi:hypothetical protein